MNLVATQYRACLKADRAPVPTEADKAAVAASVANSNRPGGELRGNNTDRKRRAAKLVAEFGDGENCLCVYCGITLNARTVTQDRIYTAVQGGRYRIANLLPACMKCNNGRELASAGVLDFILATESREGQMI